jgi:hypothetical protein
MSEIQFVNRLGDALDVMADASAPLARRHRRHLPRLPRGRSRLLIGLAVALVGGGAAAAATLISSQTPTVIAARGLTCVSGTPANYNAEASDVPAGAGTPQQACASLVGRPASKLVACLSAKYGVYVFYRDGDRSECHASGMRPLPSSYQAAANRVATLVRELNRLQASRNCFSIEGLTSATDSTLKRLGFQGWLAAVQPIPHGLQNLQGWHCAQYPDSGARYSDAAAAVSTNDNSGPGTVAITTGPSRHEDLAIQALNRRNLLGKTGARCYSVTAAQALVRSAVRAVFGSDTPTTFAARSTAPYTTMGLGRQPRYDAGCAVLVAIAPIPSGTVQALIWQKGWPAPDASNSVPNSAYKPVLDKPQR